MASTAAQPGDAPPVEASDARRARIREALPNAQGGSFVLFRGSYRELPVVEIASDIPVYRAANGRLIMQLAEVARATGHRSKDALLADQDTDAVQSALHKQLVALAQAPEGPIYQELEHLGQQTEPLLVTADGVVVNGNRRLAAMRELLAREPQGYAGFARIRVAVLPEEAGVDDIEYIESSLQLAPETKLSYHWINRRLKLRRQRDELGLPVDSIIASYRLSGEDELERELAELELAEAYLDTFLGEPGAYQHLDDTEPLFVGLNATLAEPALADKRLWRLAGFAMVYARSRFKLVDRFPFAPPQPAHAPAEALATLAVAEHLVERQALEGRAELPAQARERLAQTLADRDQAVRLTQQLLDILDQIRIDHNEQKAPRQLLKHVQSARQLAERFEAGRVPADLRGQIASELAAIQHHSQRILSDTGTDAPPPISRRQRLWRKFRRDPHRFFADSKWPWLRALRWLFREQSPQQSSR